MLACKGVEDLKKAIGEFCDQIERSTPEHLRTPVSNGFL
jgi:hypothetical protein